VGFGVAAVAVSVHRERRRFHSRGTVSGEGDALVFPPSSYLEKGQTQTYRSRWQAAGQDAYDVVTEFQVQERWVPGFKLHMQKVMSAKR